MTPQERQLVDELFDRLSKLENAPRDPDAIAAISDGLRKAPGAIYALVQTTLLQDEALKRAHDRIQELEAARRPSRPSPAASSTPCATRCSAEARRAARFRTCRRVTPAGLEQRPGDAADPAGLRPAALWAGLRPRSGSGQGYGAPPIGGGGGSFLGTAAAAAAGVVGGSLLLSSIRGMMGGSHQQAFGDTNALGDRSAARGGSDQSGGSLARDAGLNDIGSNRAATSRQGFADQASNDDRHNNDQNRRQRPRQRQYGLGRRQRFRRWRRWRQRLRLRLLLSDKQKRPPHGRPFSFRRRQSLTSPRPWCRH